jgi:hypothetical protein
MPKKLGSILWHQQVNFFYDHKRETLIKFCCLLYVLYREVSEVDGKV